METERFKIKGRHSLDLDCIKVAPKKAPKAIIQIFHGMGEHKERYLPFMEYLAQDGYAVYCHDHRNHGQSVRNETAVGVFLKEDLFTDMVDDAYFLSRKILKDYPGKDIYILGHSMGSIIARYYLGEYPLVAKKAILMGTLPGYSLTKALPMLLAASVLKLFTSKTKPSEFLAEKANKGLQPEFGIPRTKFDWLSREVEVVDAYINDPLCGYAYTPQFYIQFGKGLVTINKSSFISKTKDIPILFISGEADPVGEMGKGVTDIFRQFSGHGYTQLTLKLIPEAKHEILNETDRLTTYEIIKDWLNEK